MFGRREWAVVLALLVTPAIGFGQWSATLDLMHDRSIVGVGESFTLSLGLDSNQPVGSIQYALSVDGGTNNAAFEGAFDAFDLSSYGSLFSPPVPLDSNLFSLSDVMSQMTTTPVSLDGLSPEMIFRLFGETGQSDMGVFPGGLVSYAITALEPGTFDFGLSDAILANGQGHIVPIAGSFTVMVTPEPASALLLLLAAVPFLFRRRG